MRVFLTGAAGFIGFHCAQRFLREGVQVLGIDNLNAYYDVSLKKARLGLLQEAGFRFTQVDLADFDQIGRLVQDFQPTHVVHLAAQAGVRYSIENPRSYASSNLDGFLSILEACRHLPEVKLLYASSSSVYGGSSTAPFAETERADRPVSLYAATKRANELMAHTYAHLYGVRSIGMRFFTVYGSWGRPDMAYYGFTRAMLAGEPIRIFNNGDMSRDFTYVGDVVSTIFRLLDCEWWTEGTPPHAIINIGSDRPVRLMDFVQNLADVLGVTPKLIMEPMQPGDVPATHADLTRLHALVGAASPTPLIEGLSVFADWYRSYHGAPDRAGGLTLV